VKLLQFVDLEAVDRILNLVIEFYIQPTLDLMDAGAQPEKPAGGKKGKKRKASGEIDV
jgi:hypothetical protein